MGIPFYFREIVQQNKGILTNLNTCHRLYLDFNSIIHVASQKVVSTKVWRNYSQLEEAIFQYIIKYTNDVVSSCRPLQLLYIGIDGVAPVAKMVQQRKRRHLSALQTGLINDFKSKNNIPFTHWDSNCITPGTDFMFRLNAFLKGHYLANKTPYEVVVSGPDEVGEGEHKIIKYIKGLGNDKCVDVIYGLDADLIMLSLTCNKEKVFLMREATQFSNGRGKHQSQALQIGYKYVNIDVLRKHVGTYLYPCSENKEVYMYDYVFICFILGNDFLPHFMGFDIKHDGLNIICDIYRKLHSDTGKYLITKDQSGKYTINFEFLKTFIQELSIHEDDIIKYNIKKHFEAPYNEKPYQTPLEKYTNELNYLPLIRRQKIVDPETDMSWKATYYKTFLNIQNSDMIAVDDICSNYIEGLYWNVEYYFNCCFSNRWFYKYPTSPFISDISKYLRKSMSPVNDTAKSEDITITDKEQLLLVLPYRSLNLFNEETRKKIQDISQGYSHMYPTSFNIITFMKSQLWECIPVLPPINLDKIKSFYKTQ